MNPFLLFAKGFKGKAVSKYIPPPGLEAVHHRPIHVAEQLIE